MPHELAARRWSPASCLPPLLIATLWFRTQSSRAYETARDHIAAVNANLQEGLSGVRVSQAFVREGTQPGKSSKRSHAATSTLASVRSGSSRCTSRSSSCSPNSRLRSCSASAACWSRTARSRPAALIAFLLYLDLFFAPIQQLSQVFDSYQQARVSLDRIDELLATPTSVPAAVDAAWCPTTCGARSSFDDVHFKYATACRRSVARRRPADRCRARPSRSSARPARASRR